MKKLILTLSLILLGITHLQAQAIKNGLVLNLPFNNDYKDYSTSNLIGVIGNSVSNSTYNPYLENFNEHTNLSCQSPCYGACSDTNITYPYNCWTKADVVMGQRANVIVSSYQNKIDFSNSFTLSLWIDFGTWNTGDPLHGNILSTQYDNSSVLSGEGISFSYDFSSSPHVISFNASYPNYNSSNQLTYYSNLNLQSCCGGSTNPSVVQNFKDGKWHNLVVSFDKPNLIANLYIDNLLAQSVSVDPFVNVVLDAYPMIFGTVSSPSGNQSGIAGLLDNVKIYNRLLSSTELNTLHNDTLDTPTSNATTAITNGVKETMKAFPNPVKDKINISDFSNQTYTIINQYGSVIKSDVVNDNFIDVSELKNGMYILQINNSSWKFLKD
jgi:hypothetical protein